MVTNRFPSAPKYFQVDSSSKIIRTRDIWKEIAFEKNEARFSSFSLLVLFLQQQFRTILQVSDSSERERERELLVERELACLLAARKCL